MQEENKKRGWNKPELMILIRASKEQTVLDQCKIWDSPLRVGPNDRHNKCGLPGTCNDCVTMQTS